MGLFDEVICEFPLPGWPEGEEPRFQTKDLDCFMETFSITSDGRLLAARDERATSGTAPSAGWRDAEYHDYLVFYTSLERPGGREWFEYRAKVTDGQLVDLERIQERAMVRRAKADT